MSTWAKIVVALLVFVVLIGIRLLYIYSGAYNIAATDEHTGLVRWVLNTTQEQSIRAHADEVLIGALLAKHLEPTRISNRSPSGLEAGLRLKSFSFRCSGQ